MKSKNFFKLLIILIIAFLLRVWFLDKPEGLWNDEYEAWYIASRSSFTHFMELVSKNCHTPLYYFFLKFWINVFPDTDLSLRFSSVLSSLLTVLTMFFVGKEHKNTKTGLLCAFFTALSSFYIYFAQEVRPYSLIALISSLIVLTCIKTLKSGKKIYFIIFMVFNALLCSLHTLGLIFSFFIILYSFIYLYFNFDEWKETVKNIKKIIQYIFPFICVLFIISPVLLSIIFSQTLSQFWSGFSLSKTAFSFIDYFSPMQCNITNSPDTFRTYLFKNGAVNINFVIFGLFPSLIAFIAILKSLLLKDKILNLLIFSCLSFFMAILMFSALGKIVLLTKYTSEMYPVLILAFSTGILSYRSKIIQNGFLIIYFALISMYLYFSPSSVPKLQRAEGNKIPVILIEKSRLKNRDFIIFTYYDINRFIRYFDNRNKYNILSINKFNFNMPVFNNNSYTETIKQGSLMYRETFKEFPNKNVVNWTKELVIGEMKKGDRVGIIFLNEVSFFSNEKIKEIAEDDIRYKKTSFIFLTFSMLRNSLMYALKDDYKIDSITKSGGWTLVVYEKIR